MKEVVLQKFAEVFGDAEGAQVYFAPGRVNMIGAKFKHFFSTQKKCVPESLTFSVRIFLNGSTTNNIWGLW